MKKNIYDMLNEVEIDLNEYDIEDFSDIEKAKIKKNFKKSIRNKNTLYKKGAIIASIAILSIGLVGSNLGNQVWACANTIVYDIASHLGIEKSLDEYKTVIDKSITNNGITIKLNEVILDKDELIISSIRKYSEKIGEDSLPITADIYINGKEVSDACGGGSRKIDEYTVEDIMSYDLEENDFSGDLNIKAVFSNARINGKTKKGRWVFEFKTNGDELKLDTKEISLNNTFTLENGQNIILEKYTSNNLGQKIYYSKTPKGTDYDMVLRGHDDLGNKIEFYASRETASNGIFKLTTIHGNLNENAKILTLTPYAVKFPEKSGRMSNDFKKVGKEFTIDLSK
ncbi:DUF4179 domain-containing protein [Clostridium ganghwense]|uniref:DUF4179 domain-containing protein n=1 Tax=Clostridium ganghwense TaxID=312089 RepID=A0ABT4CK08_9CLOT|nr:DUF4179 domain-containing protein [Clostridium ganghwense]MCY6369381.1 DUF4179 domain-containing protein [Clostridium ganghwense]